MSDDKLLHIAGDRKDLLQEAAVALDAEMARRGLTHEQARSRKKERLRLDIEEAGAHHQKRNESKYFVAQMNLGACFIGVAGLLVLMITLGNYRVRDEWMWPIIVVYLGALLACLAVQEWVRQTLSFWFSLALSCVLQFLVAHWLSVYHPSRSGSGLKGSAILSLLPGYLLGGALFLVLQRLKPSQETISTN
jgi:hypothetical protein